MKKIILASRSPRRKELLEKAGLSIKIIPSNIKETRTHICSPEHHALQLALAKIENVARKLTSGIVIGADTIVVLKNKIFGKPKNAIQAKKILTTLSDTKHAVYTAIAVMDLKTKRRIVDIDKSIIITRKIPQELIKTLAYKNHDKAGAYAVQENSDILVKKIEGDYYNVVGLPLKKLKKILKIFSVNMNAF